MPDRRRGPSDAVLRAQRLLVGGAIGGHVAGIVSVVAFWVIGGTEAGLSSAIAAAATLAFYIIGLAVQVAVADDPPRRILLASLVSYAARISLLGVLGWTVARTPAMSWLDPLALVVTTIAVVLGWLGAEVRVFSRLRIPVFDPPEETGAGTAPHGSDGE